MTLQDFLELSAKISLAENIFELKRTFIEVTSHLGFQQFAYARFNMDDLIPEETIYTFSDVWALTYVQKNYQRIDPVFTQAFAAKTPFFWSGKDYQDDIELCEFFNESKKHGVFQGYTIPLKSLSKSRCFLTYIFPEPSNSLQEYQNNRTLRIAAHALAESFHQSATRFSRSYDLKLKTREREVLTLSAHGLTSEEIADFLGIKSDYVHEVISNALNRLGTRNRLAAVVRALELGEISG